MLPWSEWNITPGSGRRISSASCSARITRNVSHEPEVAQPTTRHAHYATHHRCRISLLRLLTEFDPSREIYLPWSSTFDLWRARRGLSRIITTVDKAHMLAPILRNGAGAIVASSLAQSLREQTGCTIQCNALDAPAPLPHR